MGDEGGSGYRYSLELGVSDRTATFGSQGVFGPYWVRFDEKGTIVGVEDIVYGH